MSSSDPLLFAETQGEEIPAGIAFSAASTIKVPVMAASLSRYGNEIPRQADIWIRRMIELSENQPADDLMVNTFGSETAPIQVTDIMQSEMGMPDSFLAGLFKLGSPLMQLYKTQANSRTDFNLEPDPYNQTTPKDMGTLLNAVYQCSVDASRSNYQLPEGISVGDCKYMLDRLTENKIGALAEAGVPDGTRVAHKHGWTEESDGFLHTISDVGVVFTPGGDYVYAIFLYQKSQLLFDPANALIARISQILYNSMNNEAQANWLWDPVFFPN